MSHSTGVLLASLKASTPRPELLRCLLAVVATAWVYLQCPFGLVFISGASMAPTLSDGAICLLDRGKEAVQQIRQGDIIVFEFEGAMLTKRVVAAPGQTIRVVDYGDGTYGIPRASSLSSWNRKMRFSAIKLVEKRMGSDELFVLGDNRSHSLDSRDFGAVSTNAVVGRLIRPLAKLPAREPSAVGGAQASAAADSSQAP